MAHTYMLFDFGADEEKAQLARHKLEGWKQAFRLDKKLQYKLERGEAESETKAAPEPAAKAVAAPKAEKPKANAKAKGKQKPADADAKESANDAVPSNGKVNLLVRLPSEEPFKEASPKVVLQNEPQFDEVVKQFESLE